jgi:hypothetical protein
MGTLRILVYRAEAKRQAGTVMRDISIETESPKRITKGRAARILAETCPEFRRRRGRASSGAGVQVLPFLEEIADGWRAWRLCSGDNRPSGFEPPLKGRVGRRNSVDNPFSDRKKGNWERAEISVVREAS